MARDCSEECNLAFRVIWRSIQNQNPFDVVKGEGRWQFIERIDNVSLNQSGVCTFEEPACFNENRMKLPCPGIFIPAPRMIEVHERAVKGE